MKRLLATAALAVITTSPALAGDRWLVYTGGEKPGRIFVVVDETYLDAVPFAEKTCKLENGHHPRKCEGARLGVVEHDHRLPRQMIEEKLRISGGDYR